MVIQKLEVMELYVIFKKKRETKIFINFRGGILHLKLEKKGGVFLKLS